MIDRPLHLALVAGLAILTPTMAMAHAHLSRATPAAGATVKVPPEELALSFTEKVVVALSKVDVAKASGGSVAVAKPAGDGPNSTVLHIRPTATLAPGAYVVTWRVVAVDTHPTSGSYKFTIAP